MITDVAVFAASLHCLQAHIQKITTNENKALIDLIYHHRCMALSVTDISMPGGEGTYSKPLVTACNLFCSGE